MVARTSSYKAGRPLLFKREAYTDFGEREWVCALFERPSFAHDDSNMYPLNSRFLSRKKISACVTSALPLSDLPRRVL